ncbi:hypothetical protein [Streptomyces canus]
MAALLESKTLRDGVLERTDEVGLTAIRSLVLDHRTSWRPTGTAS